MLNFRIRIRSPEENDSLGLSKSILKTEFDDINDLIEFLKKLNLSLEITLIQKAKLALNQEVKSKVIENDGGKSDFIFIQKI